MGSVPHAIPPPDLLPNIIAHRATTTPNRVFAITPRSADDLEAGFGETTYAQLARAVDALAWWMDEELGKAEEGAFETVAYVGPADLRYSIVVVAAQKTGRKVLLPLTQNSFEAHINLVEKTDAKTLLGAGQGLPIWKKVKERKPEVRILTVPELDELIQGEPVPPYPFTKTWEEGKNDPVHVNHTSGTTGLPKPITSANVWAQHFLRDLIISSTKQPPLALATLVNRTTLVFMPPEWILGLALQLHMPLYLDTVPVILPASAPRPLTAAYVDRVHQLAPRGVVVDSGFYVPDLLKQLVKSDEHLANMRALGLGVVYFGGAPLAKAAGDALADFAAVQPVMGATEIGPFPVTAVARGDRDWDYYGLDEEHYSGVRMRPFDGADDPALREMVVERVPGEEELQIIFRLCDDDVYRTKDLFREHESKKGRWKYVGRTDDFVKLGSLTKFSASDVEAVLDRHPLVRDVVVGGDGRKAPFVLVQLKEGAEGRGRDEVLDELWPVFEQANGRVADEIQLRRELVLFATPDKPFRKSGKGSINRRATLAAYEEEVGRLYARFAGEE